jgi:hypothetical protein
VKYSEEIFMNLPVQSEENYEMSWPRFEPLMTTIKTRSVID